MASRFTTTKRHPKSKRALIVLFTALLATCLVPSVSWAKDTVALTNLKLARAAAQQELNEAKAAQGDTQADLDAAEAVLESMRNRLTQALEDAQADLAAKDAAYEAASQALLDANNELTANAAAIEAAQASVQAAQSDGEQAGAAIEQANARVDAATQALRAAEAARDAAWADIKAETNDPGTNEGHLEWTAYGFFQFVRDNSEAGSAAYWDAQCAMDILDGGVNTTGHVYPKNQGPEPDGYRANEWTNIAPIAWSERGDAVSLDNFGRSLQFLNEFNAIRGEENSTEGTNLSTNIPTNCRQMAISIVQCDISKNYSVGHTQAYEGLENLSWSSSRAAPFSRNRYRDPFVGWYDEEKANYKANNGGVTGHYETIVDLNSGYYCNLAGFAICNYNASYGECRELSTFGDFFESDTNPDPEVAYSVDDFSALFDAYYANQVAAGMYGTPDEVRQAHQEALASARADVDSASLELEAAQNELENAQAAQQDAASRLTAAQGALTTEQGKTANLENNVAAAQSDADEARDAISVAQAAVEAAQAQIDALDDDPDYKAAVGVRDKAKAANDAALEDVAAAQEKLAVAQKDISDYADLSKNPDVRVTFRNGSDSSYYCNQVLEPPVDVWIANEKLNYESDYSVWYEGDQFNAGQFTIAIGGTKEYQVMPGVVSEYRGIFRVPYTIKPVWKLVPEGKTFTYDGKSHTGVKGTSGYTLKGKTGVANGKLQATKVGTYVVTATLHNRDHCNYVWKDGGSDQRDIKWKITPRPLTDKSIKVSGIAAKAYTGNLIKPKPVVKYGTKTLKLNVDYTLSYSSNRSIGKKAVVKITGKGNFKGSISKTFEIKKRKNTIAVAPVTKVVSASLVAKNPQLVKGALKVTKAQGRVVYAKIAKGSDKALSINGKTGRITVAKGAAKGLHKIKVKVTAKGTATYGALSRTVTVSVKVR